MPFLKNLDQFDLHGQMIRIVRADAPQFPQKFRGDALRLRVSHTVHDAVPHRLQRIGAVLLSQPVDQKGRGRAVAGGRNRQFALSIPCGVLKRQAGAGLPDALDLAQQGALERLRVE